MEDNYKGLFLAKTGLIGFLLKADLGGHISLSGCWGKGDLIRYRSWLDIQGGDSS